MEKIFLFAYETKLIHIQGISQDLAVWFFFFCKDQFNRHNIILQITSIWDSAFSTTTLTCWIYDLHDLTCAMDRYDLNYKNLFIVSSKWRTQGTLKAVKSSSPNVCQNPVLATVYCIAWFIQSCFGFFYEVILALFCQTHFFALYDNKAMYTIVFIIIEYNLIFH